ncbi:MAG: sigma-70 family RNA polymerase sigma factor [Opitutae bacterium]|nr:sigma-70 family RNA polymerase sigma factor [Opitutae bacterium]
MNTAPDNAEPDEALMTRLRSGDEAALAALMARWERPIKRYLARVVQNTAEAEELAQETFVRVYQQRARFRAGARFSPWLYAIAANLARNRLRWWRRRPAVSLDAWTELGHETADEHAAGQTGAKPLEQRERAEAVRAAVAALPVELREALVLCEYERLSQAEAAEALGVTVKAIETRLYRARARLREQLQRWWQS